MARHFPISLTSSTKNILPRLSLGVIMTAGAIFTGTQALADHLPTEANPMALQTERDSARNTRITAMDLLTVAEQQVGVAENASGGGTPFHDWYMSSPRAKETVARDGGDINAYANAPWCEMFVSWVGEKAGLRHTVGWDAYTVTHAKWFRDNGRWGARAQSGAVVYFDWDGERGIDDIDHVGLVKRDNGDGTITTIEGNTGNGKVEERVRPIADVVGYGYPRYAS